MTKKERTFLLDLQGFIVFSLSHPNSIGFEQTLSSICNDTTLGLSTFRHTGPQTLGYSKHLK